MFQKVRHRLPYGPEAPAAAREALAFLDGRIGPDALQQLRLLVSELVTNSVRHGRPREEALELELALGTDFARVAVTDGGEGFTPPPEAPESDHPGGWGLVIVDRIARRWGVENVGKTRVWLELDLAGSR